MQLVRLSVPVSETYRGAGLGNEIFGWAKAFIGAQELSLRCVHPAWGLNARGYSRDFGTSRLDWPAQRLLRTLPKITVDKTLLQPHDDYADVMRSIRARVDDRVGPLVVWHASGMAGGYFGIRRARHFLLTELSKPMHVNRDLYEIGRRLDSNLISIAVHLRLGDFETSDRGPRSGEFNRTIPISWYVDVVNHIRHHFRGRCQVLSFTNEPTNQEVRTFEDEVGAIPLPARIRPLLSDLLAMSSADLLVCSVSSFSMLAAFLSMKPYVWYGPHLSEVGGFRSLWGHEPQQREGIGRRNALTEPSDGDLLTRGMVAEADAKLPGSLWDLLDQALKLKDTRRDLLMYGVVPTTRGYFEQRGEKFDAEFDPE